MGLMRRSETVKRFVESLHVTENVFYTLDNDLSSPGYSTLRFRRFPNLVFNYMFFSHSNRPHRIRYRPSRLNGRHIIDVFRAVCESSAQDVFRAVCASSAQDESTLDRAREEATKNAVELFKGV